MAKFVPTQAQQQIEAARFVGYELWMFRACTEMPKPRDIFEKNVWYEGLVLHARVLRDFFWTRIDKKTGKRNTWPTDIVAVDYFTDKKSWPFTYRDLPKYLADNRERMDQALAHLSFCRLDFNRSKKEWSAKELRTAIGEKWIEFIGEMQKHNEPAAAAFVAQAHRRKLPLAAPF